MKFLLLQSKVIHTDDTSIKLLEGKGVVHTAKFWPYLIAQLSQVEKQLRKTYPHSDLQGHRDFEAVAAASKGHSVPILKDFKQWLDAEQVNK